MFRDRQEAGKKLALKLKKILRIAQDDNFMVVALLRGGIVLGKKISDYFKIPLFPLAVKKIGAPSNPELAIGAVTFDKIHYFDENLIRYLDVDQEYMKNSLENKSKEAQLLQKKFPTSPGLRRVPDGTRLRGARVVIVDDGVATGTTVICASIYAKKEKAKEIILATPVISKTTLKIIKQYFDRTVSLKMVDNLTSVSQFYQDFPQVTDQEALGIIDS